MPLRKILTLILVPVLLVSLSSCGSKISGPITFEQGPMQLSCDSGVWNGVIYFKVKSNTGPEFEERDSASNDYTVTNYNCKFELLNPDDNIVATSSLVETVGPDTLSVTFSPRTGYEATQYVAYLDGTQIAAEDVGIWAEYPKTPVNIIDGICKTNFDIDWEEFEKTLYWRK